jgi:VanZ family protein
MRCHRSRFNEMTVPPPKDHDDGSACDEEDAAPQLGHWKSAPLRCLLWQITQVATLHRSWMETPLSTLGKAALAGCVIALAILAWAPAHAMTRTPLGGHAEHFVAYLGTAIVFGLTLRTTQPLAMPCLLLIGYAAIMECGQLHAPGRHASFHDFAFSAGGVLVGGILVWIARQCWPQCWPRNGNRPAR